MWEKKNRHKCKQLEQKRKNKQMLEYFSKLAKIAQNFVSSKLTKFEIRNWTGVECQYGEGHFIPTQLVKGPQCGNLRIFLSLRFYVKFILMKFGAIFKVEMASKDVKIAIFYYPKLISRRFWVAGKFLRFYTVGSKSSFGTCLKLITLKIVL